MVNLFFVVVLAAGFGQHRAQLVKPTPSAETLRMQVLMNYSFQSGPIDYDFSEINQPSHLTYDRIDGGMK